MYSSTICPFIWSQIWSFLHCYFNVFKQEANDHRNRHGEAMKPIMPMYPDSDSAGPTSDSWNIENALAGQTLIKSKDDLAVAVFVFLFIIIPITFFVILLFIFRLIYCCYVRKYGKENLFRERSEDIEINENDEDYYYRLAGKGKLDQLEAEIRKLEADLADAEAKEVAARRAALEATDSAEDSLYGSSLSIEYYENGECGCCCC